MTEQPWIRFSCGSVVCVEAWKEISVKPKTFVIEKVTPTLWGKMWLDFPLFLQFVIEVP